LKFHADSPLDNSIEATGEGWVRIGGQTYDHSVVVTHTGEVNAWPYPSVDELTPEVFTTLAQIGPELIILGTGAQHQFLHPSRFHALIAMGIGLESMSNAAACRTYNVLISEGRRVLLALVQPASTST
jgi:uncharacterized protein